MNITIACGFTFVASYVLGSLYLIFWGHAWQGWLTFGALL